MIDLDYLVPEFESQNQSDLDRLLSTFRFLKKIQPQFNDCMEPSQGSQYQKMDIRAKHYKGHVCQPLTLDQYSDSGLTYDQLWSLNRKQVISRHLARTRRQSKISKLHPSRNEWKKMLVATREIPGQLLSGFHKIPRVLRGLWHHQPSQATNDAEKGQWLNPANDRRPGVWPGGDPRRILVVPQLWMFQIGRIISVSV